MDLTFDITSQNPVVKAIIEGSAPQLARLAARSWSTSSSSTGSGLEVLVALSNNSDAEIAEAANETLQGENPDELLIAAKADETAPTVLAYLASQADANVRFRIALILNSNTPDEALAVLAATTKDGPLLELVALNQQRLSSFSQLIEAILENAGRTAEAERRARETKKSF